MAQTISYGSPFQGTTTIPASSAHSVLGTTPTNRPVLIHDFALGAFTTKVKLQFPLVLEKWVYETGLSFPISMGVGPLNINGSFPMAHYLGGTQFLGQGTIYNSRTQANTFGLDNRVQKKNQNPGGYAILLDLKGNGNPADFVVNLTSIFQGDGAKFTRTSCYEGSDTTDLYNNTIVGDYTLTYNTSGNYDPAFVLYAQDYYVGQTANYTRYNNNLSEYTGNTTVAGFARYYDVKRFYLNLRQQVVAVVHKNGPTGATLAAGTVITGMDPISNATVVLDKSQSRMPPGASSRWVVAKQTAGGGYALAIPGVDYNLGGGETLTSDLIHVTWIVGATQYRINCFVEDSDGGGGYYQPSDVINIDFPVSTTTLNDITFPTIVPNVVPTSTFMNIITNTTPLTGVQTLELSVSASLNLTSGSWTQTIDGNPPTVFSLSDADWRAEMLAKTNVVCKVKKAGTNIIVQQRSGFGPHTFSLLEGEYEVGYTISPKTVVIADLSSILDPMIAL